MISRAQKGRSGTNVSVCVSAITAGSVMPSLGNAVASQDIKEHGVRRFVQKTGGVLNAGISAPVRRITL